VNQEKRQIFKMKRLRIFLGGVVALGILSTSTRTNAISDYSLLVGEWSETGACGRSRYVFTQDGHYVWIKNQGGNWSTQYEGFYIPLDDNKLSELGLETTGAVVVAPHPNAGGNLMEVHTLTETSYSGMWNAALSDGLSFDDPDDAFFSYIRCPTR
jgi:hypothetical protein